MQNTPEFRRCFSCDCGYRAGSRFFVLLIENGRCCRISNKGHQINEEIRDKEVRLVSATGEQLGIMSAREALEKAMEADLDLVKISPHAVPPVCERVV